MRIVPPNSSHPRRVTMTIVVAALAIAACGGDSADTSPPSDTSGPSDAPSATGSTAATGPVDAAAFPVTIEHKYGSTTIPEEPERVVSVGFTDQDFILALGVTPVGIRDWYGEQPFGTWPWAQDELGSAEPEVLASDDLSIEQVAALDPDVIVGISSGMTEEQYETLSRIAPTIAQPGEYLDYGTPWQDQTLMTGVALGRSAEAAALVADIEGQFARARADHPEFANATAAVAFYFDEQPGAYASQDGRSRIMSDFGFTIPTEFDELAGESFFASFSAEQIDLLDTDVIVWIGGDELTISSLVESPLRGGMAAVRAGREVFADVELGGAFSFGSPLSLPYLIEHLVPELAVAVDGDPATVVPSAEAIGATDAASPSTPGPSTPASNTDDAAEAAGAAWSMVFDSSIEIAEKTPHLEDAAALAPTLADYAATGDTMGGITLTPTAVTVDGETATVTYDVMFGGTAAYEALTGTLSKIGDTWVVGRTEFCGFMASARLSCP